MHKSAPTELIIQDFYQEVKSLCENLKQQVQDYIEKYRQDKLPLPCSCPRCRNNSGFKYHGVYYRNLRSILYNFKGIPIIRYKCLRCGKTFADIPEFIEKNHHYAKSIIKFIVKKLTKYSCLTLHKYLIASIFKELQLTLVTKEQLTDNPTSPNNTSKKVFRIESITNLAKPQTISITTLFNWEEEFISVYTQDL